jgi:hypothetical protein
VVMMLAADFSNTITCSKQCCQRWQTAGTQLQEPGTDSPAAADLEVWGCSTQCMGSCEASRASPHYRYVGGQHVLLRLVISNTTVVLQQVQRVTCDCGVYREG